MGFRNSIFGISEIELADARDVIAPHGVRAMAASPIAGNRGGRAGGEKL